jgi:hypothetical protein
MAFKQQPLQLASRPAELERKKVCLIPYVNPLAYQLTGLHDWSFCRISATPAKT